MRELLAPSLINYKPPCYRSTRTHQHHKRIHTQNIFTLKGKNYRAAWNKQRRRPSNHFFHHIIVFFMYIFLQLCLWYFIFFIFFIFYLNENLAGFLIMISPNGPYASNNFFFGQKLSTVGADWFSSAQIGAGWCILVQISAGWCSLMQIGAAWCAFVQFDADYRILGQSSSIWCRLVQLAAGWCSLVQLGEDWCGLV